ncbi:MAG: metallophosphoesterase [Planctomycetes bacterium]|nr:metallophosphoesterase [Planctomycetota bacterium]
MPKHAILSDVHANLEALQAVYRDFARLDGLRSIVSLGDLVGYGPNPAEVIAGLNSLAKKGYSVQYCMGNHDAAVLGHYEFVDFHDPADAEFLATHAGLKDFAALARQYQDPKTRKYVSVTANAKASTLWTRAHLAEPYRQFLAQQSKDHLFLGTGVLCVHGSPRDPLFGYILSGRRAQKALEAPLMTGVGLCFIGHTHLPSIWQLRSDQLVRFAGNVICMEPPRLSGGPKMTLDLEATITLVNVGAVGQPRDRNPAASYAIYDDEAHTVELRRVPYDVAATRAKILASGLPPALADKLDAADAERGVAEPHADE